jgi:hypothetical protein
MFRSRINRRILSKLAASAAALPAVSRIARASRTTLFGS